MRSGIPGRRKSRKSAAAASEVYDLVLYISGATEHSRLALANIRSLGERHLEGRYRLAVVDLFQDPGHARKHDVVAVPMLVKTLPLPLRRMIGDLSDEERVLIGLDLAPRVGPKPVPK
jgi:circadian clock protein KaiB